MSRNLLAKYYQENKERLQKNLCIQKSLRREKTKAC